MKNLSVKKLSGPPKKAVLIIQPQVNMIPVKNSSKFKSAIECNETKQM